MRACLCWFMENWHFFDERWELVKGTVWSCNIFILLEFFSTWRTFVCWTMLASYPSLTVYFDQIINDCCSWQGHECRLVISFIKTLSIFAKNDMSIVLSLSSDHYISLSNSACVKLKQTYKQKKLEILQLSSIVICGNCWRAKVKAPDDHRTQCLQPNVRPSISRLSDPVPC